MLRDIAVLGSGITGLIAGYLLDADVIGIHEPPQPWVPIYLWDTRCTQDFIMEVFGYADEAPSVKAEICFVYDGEIIPPKVGRDLYSRKVYGEPKSNAGCKGRNSFRYLKIPVPVLASYLQKKVTKVYDEIVHVDAENNLVELADGNVIEYAEIYSTIPLNVMLQLTGYTHDDLDIPTPKVRLMYYDLDYIPPFQLADCFTITYVCDQSEITRVFNMNSYFVVESTEPHKVGAAPKLLNKIGLKKIDNVKLIGRYGTWDPDILLHNVIEELMRVR